MNIFFVKNYAIDSFLEFVSIGKITILQPNCQKYTLKFTSFDTTYYLLTLSVSNLKNKRKKDETVKWIKTKKSKKFHRSRLKSRRDKQVIKTMSAQAENSDFKSCFSLEADP